MPFGQLTPYTASTQFDSKSKVYLLDYKLKLFLLEHLVDYSTRDIKVNNSNKYQLRI